MQSVEALAQLSGQLGDTSARLSSCSVGIGGCSSLRVRRGERRGARSLLLPLRSTAGVARVSEVESRRVEIQPLCLSGASAARAVAHFDPLECMSHDARLRFLVPALYPVRGYGDHEAMASPKFTAVWTSIA